MGPKAVLIGVAALIAAGACIFVLSSTEPDGYGVDFDTTTELDERRASLKGTATNETTIEAEGALAADLAILGSVLDENEEPVAGVRVTAAFTAPGWDPENASAYHDHFGPDAQLRREIKDVRTPSTGRPEPVAEATTDDEGRFRIEGLKAGSYSVLAVVDPPKLSTRASTTIGGRWSGDRVTVRLMTGTEVKGRVVDASDRPVAAVVRASWSDDSNMYRWRSWRSENIATRSTDGGFIIPAAPKGKLRFRVIVGDRLTLTGFTFDVPSDDDIVIRIPGGQGTIQGLVSDRKGQVVAGADVLVDVKMDAPEDARDATLTAEFVAKTAGNGAYRLEGLPDGNVTRIRAIAQGFLPLYEQPPLASWSGMALAGDLHEVDLTLLRGGRVHGVIRARDSGEPLADAQVHLYTATGSRGVAANHAPLSAESDSAGRFVFNSVPSGRLILIATHATHYLAALHPEGNANESMMYRPGHTPRSPRDLTIVMPDDGATVERDLELEPGYTIEGTVVDPDGLPVADATVHVKGGMNQSPLHNWGVSFWNNLKATTRTGSDGAFTYSALPARPGWVLYAKKKGFAGAYSDAVELKAGEDTPHVTLELVAGATIKGHVRTTDGDPVAGANVNLWSNQSELAGNQTHASTDDEGAFEIAGLPAGSYQMWVYSSNYTAQNQSRVESLAEGEVRTGIEVEVGAGVQVSGTVTDSNGKAVPNLQLGLQSNTGGIFHQANTDSNGRFRFTSAQEGSTSYVSVLVGGSWTKLGDEFEPPVADLELTYDPPPTHVIAGRVLGPDDEPVPLCNVSINGKEGASSDMGWSPGSSPNEVVNGVFRRSVTGTPPFTIQVSAPRDREGQPLNLLGTSKKLDAVPTKPVVLKLEGGQEVLGRVLTQDGTPVAGVTVTSQDGSLQTTTGSDGRFVLGGIKGQLGVNFQVPKGYVVPTSRTLSPDKEVVVTLLPGFEIKGTALGPDGEPLDQGWVNANWNAVGDTPGGATNASVGGGGTFTLQGIPEGVLVNVQVNAGWSTDGPRYAPANVSDVRPGTDDLVVELGSSVVIEGTVVDEDGKAFTEGWVFAQTPEGSHVGGYSQIQSGGKFRMQGLAPGTYKLGVHRQSGAQATNLAEVTAPASGVVLQLPDSKSLSGRLDGDSPFEGFWVRAKAADGDTQAHGKVQADGTWKIPGVADTSQWIVMAGSQNDNRYGMTDPVDAGAENVVVKLREGLQISGRVEDASGSPVKQSWVMASRKGWSTWAQTDDDGAFTIRGLPPGDYSLQVLGLNTPNQIVKEGVAAGTENLVLTR